MIKLIQFEWVRMKNNLTLLFAPLLIILIFVAGYLFSANSLLGAVDLSNPPLMLLNLYNFSSQFLYLGLMYIFISSFAGDFSKGIYPSLRTMNYSLAKCFTAKAINLFLLTGIFVDLCVLIFNIILSNPNTELLMMVLVALNLNLLYILILCMLLSVCIRKTLPAVLTCLGAYIVLDVVNQFVGFVFQIADNSFTNYTLYQWMGIPKHSAVNYSGLDIEKYHWLYISLPSLAWIGAMLLIIAVIVWRTQKKSLR